MILASGAVFPIATLVVLLSGQVSSVAMPTIAVWSSRVLAAADLDRIRAAGASAVASPWPEADSRVVTARQMAAAHGLDVIPGVTRPDVAGPLRSDAIPAALWRSWARGRMTVTVDIAIIDRDAAAFSAVAGIAREFEINGTLLAAASPGPPVRFDGRVANGLDVRLLDARRTWLLVATNASAARVRGYARLPAEIPYAMWLNLLDGSSMAMLEDREGPKWGYDIPPWGVEVYVIDKTLR